MKPFIKPRGTVPVPAAPAPAPRVSPGELTILAVASAIADSAERSAYLDRVCAEDADLRARLEQRLAERAAASMPVPAPMQRAEIVPSAGRGGGAVALVPMGDMQLTPAGRQPARHSPFPWLLATVLAGAVGALAVVFSNERAARTVSDHTAQTAQAAKVTAESERDQALAKAMEASTVASRSTDKLKEEERLRQAAEAQAAEAKAVAGRATAQEADTTRKANEKAAAAEAAAVAARRDSAAQKIALQAEQAATLEKLAASLIEQGRHGEAITPAQTAATLREQPAAAAPPGSPPAPPVVAPDARFLLGSALMGKGDVAAAEKEFLAVIGALEPYLPQGGEPAKAKYATVVKKLAQLYSSTGRKREATEWRRKLEAPR